MTPSLTFPKPVRSVAQQEHRPPEGLLSSFQFQWAAAAFSFAAMPALLWLRWPVSVLMVALLSARIFSARRITKAWPGWLRFLLLCTALAVVISSYGSILGRAPGGALLLLMMALKTTESSTKRDARLLVSVSFFVLIAGFLMEQSMLATLGAAVATVISFGALEVLVRPVDSSTRSPFAKIAAGNVLWLLAVALPLAFALWMLFPRLASPLWGTAQSGQARTGLSDSVKPGSFAELLADDTPVMRVRFEGQAPPANQLYFRGYVLWGIEADGSWSARNLLRDTRGRLQPSASDLRYEVSLETTGQSILYAADLATGIEQSEVFFSNERRFLRSTPVNDPMRYVASSRLSDRFPEQLDFSPATYLYRASIELPAQTNPRTRKLGEELAQRYNGDRAGIANEVLRMFRDGRFGYSMAPPEVLGINTTDGFLFDTQIGYCQHYANAFAWILRAAKVPTRIVVGYAGGRYYGFGSSDPYLLIKQERAHAWNEVLIDGNWVRFDPTAQIPPERIDDDTLRQMTGEGESEWLNALNNFRERASNWWSRTVLEFNAERQSNLLKPFGIDKANWQQLAIALMATLAAIGLVWWLVMLWRARERTTLHAVDLAYRKVLARLQKRGLQPEPDESAQAFARRVTLSKASYAPAFESLSQRYTELCYQTSIDEQPAGTLQSFIADCDSMIKQLRSNKYERA